MRGRPIFPRQLLIDVPHCVSASGSVTGAERCSKCVSSRPGTLSGSSKTEKTYPIDLSRDLPTLNQAAMERVVCLLIANICRKASIDWNDDTFTEAHRGRLPFRLSKLSVQVGISYWISVDVV